MTLGRAGNGSSGIERQKKRDAEGKSAAPAAAGRGAGNYEGAVGGRRAADPRRQWSSTTLLALLARLEEKGYVAREKEGRGYLYTAVLTREEYLPVESRSALGRMFGGSAKNLVAAMAETNTLTDAEIDELADFLEQLRREGR